MPISQREREFCGLLERNIMTINGVCIRLCRGNAFLFDELRQECILELWAEFGRYGLSRFRGESAESTWIYRICHNAAMHYMRNPRHDELQVTDAPFLAYMDGDDGWHMLDELTERLNNRERALLEHYLNGDTYSTIATAEGISEASARKRVSRLIKKLKNLVNKINQL